MALTAISLTVIASGITFGCTVKYSDKVIAVVSSEAEYKKADAILLNGMDEKTAREAEIKPKFGITLTVRGKLNSTEEVINAIISNNDEIIAATAVSVNGEVSFCVSENGIDELIENRLRAYYAEGAENKSEFVNDVTVEKGYFLKTEAVDIETAKSIIDSFEVKTVSVITSQVEVPYETKNIKTTEKPRGYSVVTTQGQNGLNEKTEEIVKINGDVTSSTELSNKVIKEQVAKVVTVGTGTNYISATTKANVVSAGFICPISSGKYTVSAYYGDGRNHKGIDLAANLGTPIFAAASGVVVTSGWDSDYGYNVIIEHSNGLKTRYAHANALCVSKGDTVEQGDMIATVGSTGWSTGNHLHFEVIVNGVRVNPGPYIGIN